MNYKTPLYGLTGFLLLAPLLVALADSGSGVEHNQQSECLRIDGRHLLISGDQNASGLRVFFDGEKQNQQSTKILDFVGKVERVAASLIRFDQFVLIGAAIASRSGEGKQLEYRMVVFRGSVKNVLDEQYWMASDVLETSDAVKGGTMLSANIPEGDTVVMSLLKMERSGIGASKHFSVETHLFINPCPSPNVKETNRMLSKSIRHIKAILDK